MSTHLDWFKSDFGYESATVVYRGIEISARLSRSTIDGDTARLDTKRLTIHGPATRTREQCRAWCEGMVPAMCALIDADALVAIVQARAEAESTR